MRKVKLISIGKHVFMFSILSLFLASCSMDGSDEVADLKNSKLKDSSLSKNLSILSDNKEFLDALAQQAKNSKGTVDPGIDPFARSNKKWVAIASGGGLDLFSEEENPELEFSFIAKEDSNGNDVGVVNWTNAEGEVVVTGEVDCLYKEGNKAWVRFILVLEEISYHVYIGFEDNGEGEGDEVDRYTDIIGGPVSESDISCDAFAVSEVGTVFPGEWISGNVQIQ